MSNLGKPQQTVKSLAAPSAEPVAPKAGLDPQATAMGVGTPVAASCEAGSAGLGEALDANAMTDEEAITLVEQMDDVALLLAEEDILNGKWDWVGSGVAGARSFDTKAEAAQDVLKTLGRDRLVLDQALGVPMVKLEKPTVSRMLDLSTAHVTKRDMELLEHGGCPMAGHSYPEGYFLPVWQAESDTDSVALLAHGFSKEFVAIVAYARASDLCWVNFDRDGEIYDDLPTFNW